MEARCASTASSKPPLESRFRTSRLRGWPFLAPALVVYGLFVLVPACQLAWLALQHWNGYGPQRFIGLENFTHLWSDPEFRGSLWHSVAWEIGAAALTFVGLGIGILARFARGGTALLSLFLVPILLPQIVVATIWTLAYSPLAGMVNTVLNDLGLGAIAADWLGDPRVAGGALFVAWAWSAVGVGAVICRVALGLVGREYVEIALIEGAGPIWRFAHVTLPATRRLLAVAMLINLALAGQVFDLIFATTGGGPGDATVTLPIDMYARAFGGQTGEGAAVALMQVLASVVIALLALVAIRGDTGMNAGDGDRAMATRFSNVSTGALLVFAGAMSLPVLWLVGVALGTAGVQFGVGATLDPRTWRLDSFSLVWSSGMGSAIATSVILAVVVTVSVLVLATPAAFALNHTRNRLVAGIVLLGLTLGVFQPESVLVIPLFSLLADFGLLNSMWGVYLPEVGRALPVAMLVLWAWLNGTSSDALEAAAVDGAGWWRQLWSIAVPLSGPALLGAAAWAFLTSWNEYLLPTVVSQDGSINTVPTLLGTFIGRVDTEYAALAAGCLFAILPVALLYLLLPRLIRAFVRPVRMKE